MFRMGKRLTRGWSRSSRHFEPHLKLCLLCLSYIVSIMHNEIY